MFAPEEPMDNIMYCNQTKQYVGWKKGQDELFVSTYTFTNTHFYLFVNYIYTEVSLRYLTFVSSQF